MQEKKPVNAKIFAIIALTVFIFSILPILTVSLFNHAAADDLAFSEQAFITWRETGSLPAVLQVAWDNVVSIYRTWQGTYTGVFLMTMQPGLFGEEFYFIGTFILLFGLIFSVLFFSKTLLCDCLGANRWQWLAISIPPLAVCIQTMSNSRDSFLWFNGGVLYTFTFSMYLILLTLTLKFIRKPKIITAIIISVFGFVTAGGAIPIAMLCFLTGITATVYLFIKKHPAKYTMLIAFIPVIVGSLIAALAPGHAVRRAFVQANPGNFGDVPMFGVPFVSVVYGFWTMFLTVNVPFLLTMLLISPFLYQLLDNKDWKFKYPLWVSLLSFMFICGLYVPLIYGNGFNIIDRYVNIVQMSVWILGIINTFYWLGWAISVKKINFNIEIKHRAIILLVIATLAIGTTAKIEFTAEPGGRGAFAVTAPFSAVIIYEFLTGEIQAYHAAYRDLLEFMQNDEVQPPDFRILPDIVPSVFVRPFSHSEADDFTIEWFVARMSNRYGKPLTIPTD
ncbi:MAG: hypothetical protein FWC16_08475 [Defluviitaleaceae bacterium]|nr:hypothetical protein [Defluviitaleaceae bacterium]